MNKPIIGIVGKPLQFDSTYLWHNITCYDEFRYLVVKNGGIAIELLPTEALLDFEDVEIDYQNRRTKTLSKEELEDLDKQVNMCDGFIIQGGIISCQFEIEIAKKALERNKPVIGICGGFNNILRAMGGDVKHDLSRSHDFFDRDYRHPIEIVEGTKLHKIIGKTKLDVNSLHFMIAEKEMVEPYAKITAYSSDGLVEGFEAYDKDFVFGFKWHPELMYEEGYVNDFFHEFIEASRKKA